jgi:hypothetical protein
MKIVNETDHMFLMDASAAPKFKMRNVYIMFTEKMKCNRSRALENRTETR